MWSGLAEVAPRSRPGKTRGRCWSRAPAAISAAAPTSPSSTKFRDAEAAREYLHAIEGASRADRARPTHIAVLEGSAIGGGLAVALCCDLRFGAEDAHLAVPPAKLGLLYGPVETRRLVELVGPSRAKDISSAAAAWGRTEALAIGLLDRRVPASELRGAETYARSPRSAGPRSAAPSGRWKRCCAARRPTSAIGSRLRR